MDKPRMLSGDELVARGTTKVDGALPDIGLKDVNPNGSWLEQKQIQSALEARKHLIEVERIEKRGVLSHAEWREELMLAEVTQKTGGHWQYLGHNVGKQLFLKPEEALFLMEVNCLQLKHNDVTVSLQQAYSLLLQSKISLLQYKVYASLSRLGYRVYRHEDKKPTEYEMKINLTSYPKKDGKVQKEIVVEDEQNILEHDDNNEKNSDGKDMTIDSTEIENNAQMGVDNSVENVPKDAEKCEEQVENECAEADNSKEVEKYETDENISDVITAPDLISSFHKIVCMAKTSEIFNCNKNITELETNNSVILQTEIQNLNVEKPGNESIINDNDASESTTKKVSREDPEVNQRAVSEVIQAHHNKLFKLENRQLKPCSAKITQKCFDKIPDLTQNQVVTISVPEEQYIPRNVFLNNLNYVLNLESIRTKTKDMRPESGQSRAYSLSEEANGDHVRRIRDTPANSRATGNLTPPNFNPRFALPNQFRPPNFWRPQMNYGPFNFFQRPFMFNMNIIHRFRPFHRPQFLTPRYSAFLVNNDSRNVPNNPRKRKANHARQVHFEAIKQLAARLKQLVQSGNTQEHNVIALTNLIRTFNIRYNATLRLTETYDIDETIETISLDDDEESTNKRSRTDCNDNYNANLNKLKQVGLKLKKLESRNEASSRLRRAFSNLVKKFNKSYNAEIYTNSNFEILDKKYIILESSSDSDCVVEEVPNTSTSKKLKNPFNILKRLSEKQNTNISSITNESSSNQKDNKYNEFKKIFGDKWLPSEDDFGRAEVVINFIDSKSDEYLFEFLKSQPYQFNNWLDIKIVFLRNLEETSAIIQSEATKEIPDINSIIRPEDCTDMPSVLNKLRIIKTNNEVDEEASLMIDFDVYNRDVQNFRKSNRPKPHFRVVCISESSNFPSGKDVASLHSKYNDNVSIVFCVVGVGSISYLQINPIDLPVYIPSNDLT